MSKNYDEQPFQCCYFPENSFFNDKQKVVQFRKRQKKKTSAWHDQE